MRPLGRQNARDDRGDGEWGGAVSRVMKLTSLRMSWFGVFFQKTLMSIGPWSNIGLCRIAPRILAMRSRAIAANAAQSSDEYLGATENMPPARRAILGQNLGIGGTYPTVSGCLLQGSTRYFSRFSQPGSEVSASAFRSERRSSNAMAARLRFKTM